MKLKRNLFASLSSSIWAAVIGLAVIPLYLKYLGVEAYGLIGFFATTQALLQLLDLGLAPTINREVARCWAANNLNEAGKLLRTLATVYWCVAAVIVVLTFCLAPWIAEYWLQSKKLSPETISHAVMLMGLVVACRWPIGLYQGALNGAHKLTISSSINIGMVTAGNLGAVAVLAFVKPTIEAFFIWQAFAGIVSTAAMRWAAWNVIGRSNKNKFDVDTLKMVWRFTAGVSVISLTALLLTQLDKVILSKMISLEEFGQYTLATVVASGLYVFVTPIFNVIYPRFSALAAVEKTDELCRLYRLGTRMLGSVVFPIAMVLAIFGKEWLYVWTKNPSLSNSVAPLVSLLVAGSAIHSVMYFPYALQLAYGKIRLALTIYLTLLVAMVPLIIVLAMQYGAKGGALAWLCLHVLYISLSTWLTHRELLVGIRAKWLLSDVGMPFLLAVLAGLLGYYAVASQDISVLFKLISSIGLGLFAIGLSIFLSRDLRNVIIEFLR